MVLSTEQINKIGEVGQQITSSLDLETILTKVHSSIQEFMPADIFGIAVYRADEGDIEFQYYLENGEFEYLSSAHISMTDSLSTYCIQHQKEVWFNDLDAEEYDKYVFALRPEETKAQSQIYVPLMAKNRPLGLITVQAYTKGTYSAPVVGIVRTIASYAAVAMDNLNAYSSLATAMAEMEVLNSSLQDMNQKMKKINTDISTLSAMGQKITSTLDFETIMTSVIRSIGEVMDDDIIGIGVYREKEKEVDYQYFLEFGKLSYRPSTNINAPNNQSEDAFVVATLKRRKEIVMNDVRNECKQYAPNIIPSFGEIQSMVYFPLLAKNKIVGILTVQSKRLRAYTDYQIDMLRTIASYTSTAIDNIHAYSYLATAFAETESARNEIVQLNSHLVELNNEKNEFLGIVAHDLKNPLSNIKMLSKILNEEHKTLSPEEVQEFSADILTASGRMFELITNLLDVNAIERGGIRIINRPFDIKSICANVVANYTARAEAKNIQLISEFDDGTVEAIGDPSAAIQVFENILSNAVKYSPYDKKIFVRLHVNNAIVRVEVQDQGPGMSEDDMKKLFGKFARLSAQPTGGEHSTGLGLSIVKKMVEAMNGNVWCESTLGEGATFIWTMQLAVEA
jgi:signal transduction histidine kinase